ncbi:hypothetical protein evm_013492 [Chilo suppressalis]|nr:hypothetical protein evm_013492 [Chilo suppressalis]
MVSCWPQCSESWTGSGAAGGGSGGSGGDSASVSSAGDLATVLTAPKQDNAKAFPMDGIGRLGRDPPRVPSADWWVLTTADAAGTNGLTCLPNTEELEIATYPTGVRGAKKKSWYNALYPTYKSKADDFKRLFRDLPDDERLIVGLLFIYLFITSGATLECRRVKDEELVIPNAILVCVGGDKNFLTSFSGRDKAYLMLFRIWQNALMDQPISSHEIWQWVHSCYGEELGFNSDDEGYGRDFPEEASLPPEAAEDLGESSMEAGGGGDAREERAPPAPHRDSSPPLVTNGDAASYREEEGGDTLPTDMSDTSDSEPDKPNNGHFGQVPRAPRSIGAPISSNTKSLVPVKSPKGGHSGPIVLICPGPPIGVVLPGFLERNTISGLEQFCRLLSTRLQAEAEGGAPTARKARRQRRNTVCRTETATPVAVNSPAVGRVAGGGVTSPGGARARSNSPSLLGGALLLLLILNAGLYWCLHNALNANPADKLMGSLSGEQAAQLARVLQQHADTQRGHLRAWRHALDNTRRHLHQTEKALMKLLEAIKPSLEGAPPDPGPAEDPGPMQDPGPTPRPDL